ncbi:hypothetical protein CPC08DRAFT_198234 [Agrocybe pediades]|nr:hypothetical protein CPC08DRAFT_198234 [Agrocybe pediades]
MAFPWFLKDSIGPLSNRCPHSMIERGFNCFREASFCLFICFLFHWLICFPAWSLFNYQSCTNTNFIRLSYASLAYENANSQHNNNNHTQIPIFLSAL